MKGRAQKIRLGIFLMIGSALLLVLLVFFTARKLFEKSDVYYVAYTDVSVSGLEVGSPVKYMGINVGSISDISIDPEDVNTIIIRLSLRPGTPVKVDSAADIVAMGITGLKTIEIRAGSNEAKFLKPEEYILQGTSLVEDISGRAEVIAFKVEEVLNNLMAFTQPENLEGITLAVEKVSVFSDNANSAVLNMDAMIKENREEVRQIVRTVNDISCHLELSASEISHASERVNTLMQGDTIGQILSNIRDISLTLKETNLAELIENLALTAAQTQSLLLKLEDDLDQGSEDLTDNLQLLRYTLENLNEATRKINTDPSVLIRGPRTKNSPDKRLQ